MVSLTYAPSFILSIFWVLRASLTSNRKSRKAMYPAYTYLQMTWLPFLSSLHGLWSYCEWTGMAFLISGPGQLMFELEHTISMFSSFLRGVTFSAFRAIFISKTSRSVNHAAWLVFTIPGAVTVFVQWAVSCPDWWIMWFRTLNCCFGFYISCLIFPPICMRQSRSLGVYWTSQGMHDGFERSIPVSFPSRAAMSTTPSSRYNTIPCVVVLFYRIFLAWIDHSLYSWRGGWLLFRFLHFLLFRGPFWEFIDPLFTVSLRPFVVKKMRDWENILLHELSRMVSINFWHI